LVEKGAQVGAGLDVLAEAEEQAVLLLRVRHDGAF
jgi:hypothetical protein